MIQDLSGSWYIKGTDESVTRVDSSVLFMHNDPDRSWITDPDPDHPKGTHPLHVKVTQSFLKHQTLQFKLFLSR